MRLPNRAFIKRTEEVTNHLKKLVDAYVIMPNPDGYYDENEWLFDSEESFHVYVLEDSVVFNDVRLPKFELGLDKVELEFGDEE